MDALVFLGFAIFAFILAAPLVALVRASRAARAAQSESKRLQELTDRIHSLEQAVGELRAGSSRLSELEREIRILKEKIAVAPPSAAVQAGPKAEEPHLEPSVKALPVTSATRPPAEKPPVHPVIPPPSVVPAQPEKLPTAQLSPAISQPPPRPAQPAVRTQAAEVVKSALNLEERLGTDWLNKLGIVILVIGVALFLGFQLQHVGPSGKVLVGYLVSVVMLGGGIFFERNERWRVLARAGIGGGWALLFFTTYAMNHISAARVLTSEPTDLVLLLLVAAAMVVHTLRYQSQVVTGLAFLLAFSTINISHGSVSSLWAGVILSAGLALVAVRRAWYELEIFGILAAYLNHYYWLQPIIEPMGAHHHPFPELTASTALLIAYWLIFRASYIVRHIRNSHQENVSSTAALLNTFLFLGLIAYQAARPELAFPFLLAVGSVEMVLGQLRITRRRRIAFVILSTVGAVLLVSAFAYKYSGGKLAVIWLLEAEALLLAGVWTREILFRRLGMLAAFLAAGHMMFVDTADLAHARNLRGFDFPDLHFALMFVVAALVLYATSHIFLRRPAGLITTQVEERGTQAMSHLAALLAVFAAWALSTDVWWAIGWSALAALMSFASWRWKLKELTLQANGLLLLAFLRAAIVNVPDAWPLLGHTWLTRRLFAVSLVAVFTYLAARWMEVPGWKDSRRVSQVCTWGGSTLIALLIWYQLRPASVALGWMLMGLVAFELGFARRSFSLRLQAYVAVAASFLRMFFVNLNAAGNPGEISPRVYTTLPLAVGFFYVFWRLESSREVLPQAERRFKAAEWCSYLGVLTVAALMRFELDADYVVAAWAALAFVLVLSAWRFEKRVFLNQALLIGFATLFRCTLHNFYERSYFPAPFSHGRLLTAGTAVAILFLALPYAFRLTRSKEAGEGAVGRLPTRILAALARRPDQVFFFVPFLLLTGLLAVEMRSGLVTLAWGIEAVSVFLVALWVGQRSFRLAGVGLLLLCVAKIVVIDVWALQPRDRYLTFIVLGIALTGVSFLYTRYRDALRQYL